MQPATKTPSAPFSSALIRWMTATLPVHGNLTILILLGYVNLIEPARSAAAYAHWVQQKATTIGSKFSIGLLLEERHRHLSDLLGGKAAEPDRFGWTFKSAGAAPGANHPSCANLRCNFPTICPNSAKTLQRCAIVHAHTSQSINRRGGWSQANSAEKNT